MHNVNRNIIFHYIGWWWEVNMYIWQCDNFVYIYKWYTTKKIWYNCRFWLCVTVSKAMAMVTLNVVICKNKLNLSCVANYKSILTSESILNTDETNPLNKQRREKLSYFKD